jgi:hypothetical protein
LPDGFTQLLNLTQLYLNDTFLDYLPGNFGRYGTLFYDSVEGHWFPDSARASAMDFKKRLFKIFK